jgi:hypothetical protein
VFTYAYICLTQKKSFVGSDVTHKGQTFSTQGAIVRKDEDDGRWAPWGFHQWGIPSGKRTKNHGKSPFLMGKSKISTGPFSIAMLVYQRVPQKLYGCLVHGKSYFIMYDEMR